MREAEIRQFAAKLGFTLKPRNGRGWMEAPCPLAPWTHPKGHDNHPSFAIRVDEAGRSVFACQSCHHKGSLANLAFKFYGFTQDEQYRELGYEIDRIESQIASQNLPQWEDEELPQEEVKQQIILDRGEAFSRFGLAYHSARCRKYLASRGIRPWTAMELGLRHDSQLDRILFPVFDRNYELRGFTGRAMYDNAELRIKDYLGLNKREVFLGEHRVFRDRQKLKYVVIVEGLFDFIKVYQAGFPVLCLLGSVLTKTKFDKLVDLNLPIIWMTDNDEAGVACMYGPIDPESGERDTNKGGLYLLNDYIPQLTVRYPKGKNDPGELSKKQIRRMVEEAELWLGEP